MVWGLSCGSSRRGQKNEFHYLAYAGWLIVLATVFDALDGKLARMSRGTSELGAQLDSLADLVTFGVAPGLLAMVLVELQGPVLGIRMHPRLLVVAPILYACCAAMRLARYNVEHHDEDPNAERTNFVGLPSPAAAGLPVALVLFYFAIAEPDFLLPVSSGVIGVVHESTLRAMPFLLLFLAVLMVSRVPFPHFVAWLTRERHPFQRMAEIVIILGLLLIEPEFALLLAAISFITIPGVRSVLATARRRSETRGRLS